MLRQLIQNHSDLIKDFFFKEIWGTKYKNASRIMRCLCACCRIVIIAIRGFISDRCGLHASALTYITLVALVPVLAIMLSFCKGIGMQNKVLAAIGMEKTTSTIIIDGKETQQFSFRIIGCQNNDTPCPPAPMQEFCENKGELTPEAHDPNQIQPEKDLKASIPENEADGTAEHKQNKNFMLMMPQPIQTAAINILVYVENTNFAALGIVGFLTLLFTVVMSIKKMEDDFNFIWRVRKGRSILRQVVEYLVVLMLIPIIIMIIFSIDSAVNHYVSLATSSQISSILMMLFSQITAFLLVVFSFMMLFVFMPNTKVKFIPALCSGILSALLWGAVQWAYLGMQIGLTRYNAIYGTFAVVPFFLAFIYLNWNVILFGCELSFAMQHHDVVHINKELPPLEAGTYYILAVTIMNEICACFEAAEGTWDPFAFSKRSAIPLIHIKNVLHRLEAGKIILRVQSDTQSSATYAPMCPPANISLNDIATLFVGTTNKDANYIASMLPPKFSKILASNSQRQHDDLNKENFAGAQHYHE